MTLKQNATITITNTLTNEYRTFRIKTVRSGSLQDKQIIELLTGPDNEADYQAFGFIQDNRIKVWKSKKSNDFKPSKWQIFAVMLESLLADVNHGKDFSKYQVSLSKRCMRCNRTLTTPESIERGIGPECAGLI